MERSIVTFAGLQISYYFWVTRMTGLRLFLLHALMLFLDLLHVAILSIEFLVTGQTSSDTFALPVLIDSTLGLMRELASEA